MFYSVTVLGLSLFSIRNVGWLAFQIVWFAAQHLRDTITLRTLTVIYKTSIFAPKPKCGTENWVESNEPISRQAVSCNPWHMTLFLTFCSRVYRATKMILIMDFLPSCWGKTKLELWGNIRPQSQWRSSDVSFFLLFARNPMWYTYMYVCVYNLRKEEH